MVFLGSIPINLQIDHMRIKRNEMGCFEIQPIDAVQIKAKPECGKSQSRELFSLQIVMQQLKLDNDSLKKQLNSLQQSTEAHM